MKRISGDFDDEEKLEKANKEKPCPHSDTARNNTMIWPSEFPIFPNDLNSTATTKASMSVGKDTNREDSETEIRLCSTTSTAQGFSAQGGHHDDEHLISPPPLLQSPGQDSPGAFYIPPTSPSSPALSSPEHATSTTEPPMVIPALAVLGPTRQERLRIIQFLRDRWARSEVADQSGDDQPILEGHIVAGVPLGEKDFLAESRRCRQLLLLSLAAMAVIAGVVIGSVLGTKEESSKRAREISPPPPRPKELKCFATDKELTEAIDEYLEDSGSNTSVASTYGWPIGNWCVSNIFVFDQVFSSLRNDLAAKFNESLAGWDVSSAISMKEMFYGAASFDHDLSMWDLSKVVSVDYMFALASKFNHDISSWNMSGVTSMIHMFEAADSFNQDISSWDVSRVESFEATFLDALSFNQRLASWDVSQATDMRELFAGARAFNQNISSWNTSQVTALRRAFDRARNFNGALSGWDVSRATDMNRMFWKARAFNRDVSSWDVSRVTDMNHMFSEAVLFNQDLSTWNVSAVQDSSFMFAGGTSFNQDLCRWGAVLNAKEFRAMFDNTACPVQEDVNLLGNPPGPFCKECSNA